MSSYQLRDGSSEGSCQYKPKPNLRLTVVFNEMPEFSCCRFPIIPKEVSPVDLFCVFLKC